MAAKTELFAKWLRGSLVVSDQANGWGNRWFVDPASTTGGATAGYGANPDSPFTTMAAALAAASDGDIIYVTGTIAEAAQTISLNNLRIIGVGPVPEANTFQEAALEQAYLFKVTGIYNSFENILFRGCQSTTSPAQTKGMCVQLSGATATTFKNCTFRGRTGSSAAIDIPLAGANMKFSGCKFLYFNTALIGAAIYGHTYAADIVSSAMLIENCIFHSNLQHIYCRMRQSVIRNNQFAEIGLKPDGTGLTATIKINLAGGANALWNTVTGNMFTGAYTNTGGYTAGTDDKWAGNWTDQTTGTYTNGAGMTLTIPQVA